MTVDEPLTLEPLDASDGMQCTVMRHMHSGTMRAPRLRPLHAGMYLNGTESFAHRTSV